MTQVMRGRFWRLVMAVAMIAGLLAAFAPAVASAGPGSCSPWTRNQPGWQARCRPTTAQQIDNWARIKSYGWSITSGVQAEVAKRRANDVSNGTATLPELCSTAAAMSGNSVYHAQVYSAIQGAVVLYGFPVSC